MEKGRTKKYLNELKNQALIILGVLSAGMGLKGFLLPNHFIDGGVTGISMLVSEVTGYPLPLLIVLINVPFVAMALRLIGLRFAVKSAAAIGALSLCLMAVDFPVMTTDKILSSIFGGFFLGGGIGAAVRGGSVLDGTEIAALLISRKSHLLKVGDVILIGNIFIFSAAAWFLGAESALYSILTYFSASKTVDFLVYGIEEYHGVMIISRKSEKIRTAILHGMGRGVTVLKGEGGLSENEQKILFCVVTRLEIPKIKVIAKEIDPSVFIVIHAVADASGGIVKKRALH